LGENPSDCYGRSDSVRPELTDRVETQDG